MRRVLSLLVGILVLAAAPDALAATSYTSCLLLPNPQVGDAGWGVTENTGRTLVDSAVAGILSLSVAGNTDVVLTSTSGSPDQARNQHFTFTGVLTGNIRVFWPAGLCRVFSVYNNTSGAFSLTVAADNGAHSPAGTTVAVPQGYSALLVSDGTNVSMRGTAVVGTFHADTLTLTNGLGVASGGTGAATLTNHGVVLGQGTAAVAVTSAGTATQVLTSNGAAADPTFQAIPTATEPVNAQTGTTYTVLAGDQTKLVTFTNGSAIAVTLPQATGSFGAGWFADFQNRGAGTVTITPTTSTVDGAASIALLTGQGVRIASDGANYFTQRGLGSTFTTAASKAQMQTGTDNTTIVTPLRVNDADGVAKAWASVNSSQTILASRNVTSITRNSAGNYTVNFTTAFAAATYACTVSALLTGAEVASLLSKATGSVAVVTFNSNTAASVDAGFDIACFGRQ